MTADPRSLREAVREVEKLPACTVVPPWNWSCGLDAVMVERAAVLALLASVPEPEALVRERDEARRIAERLREQHPTHRSEVFEWEW